MRSVRSTAALAITSVVFWAMPIALALPAAAQSGFQDIVASHEGASDQVQLLRDTTVPEIQITSPLDDSVIAGNAVTVSGTAADLLPTLPPEATPLFGEVFWSVEDESFVTIGSGTAPIVDGRFTIPDIVLGTGRHSIIVQALDSAGNGEPDAVSLTSDPDAPLVALVGIADGEAVLTSSVAADLNFAAPTILISVNGIADGRSFPAGLAPDALALRLAVGPNPVTLELDAGSGPFLFSFTIFRVESAGPIRILAPVDGSLTNQVETTVTGTVPRGTPFVTVNGAPATLEPDGVTFTAPLALAEGGNEIRAQAFPFGQEDSVRVTLDTVPPALELLFPEDGTLTGEAEVAFAGFVSEAGRVEAVGPGGAAAAATQTRVLAPGDELFGIQPILEFVFELPLVALVDGPNPIDLRLVDRAGNETLIPLTIRRSSAALVLESPAEGSALPELRTDLVLQVLEDVTLEALFSAGRRVPGFAGLALSAGALPPATATLSGVPLAPGATELRLVYRRDATGEREVLSFALESLATEVATVAGTVTDAQTGAPLEGALVTVVVNGLELVVPSGPDGRFALPVEPGDVQVVVRREGFVELVVDGMPGAGETFVADANLIPWSVGGSPAPGDPTDEPTSAVAGTVTERPTEAPLEGTLVVVTQGAFQRSAITEAPGTYAIGEIPVGGFEVTITRVGFFPQVFTVEAPEPVVAPLDVALEPIPDSVTLVGAVTSDLTGLAASGVRIEVLGTELSAFSDADGRFQIDGVPLGTQTLRLSEEGFLDGFFTFEADPDPAGHPLEFEITFPAKEGPSGGLAISPDAQGRVFDALTGEPLEGAEISADASTAVSGPDGTFALLGLPVGSFEITASNAGFIEETRFGVVVDNGPDELEFGLTSLARGEIAGRVTDAATGQPIRLAVLDIETSPLLAAATLSDGSYHMVRVSPGTYDVSVGHPGFEATVVPGVVVQADRVTTLDVALTPLPRTGGLEGIVTDVDSGAPISGVSLVVQGTALSTTTAADGSYSLNGLPAGLVTIALDAPPRAATQRTVGVIADVDATTPTTTRADFALDAAGAVPLSVTETVVASQGASLETPNGRFRFEILAGSLSGDAVVTLTPPDAPLAASGDLLALDPDLDAPDIGAVGGELLLQVESLVAGDPVPDLVGPVVMVMRYAAADAAAANIVEDSLAPYFFDGNHWTVLRTIPYLHAVDQVNKIVVMGVIFNETETNALVTARLRSENPVLLAQAGDDPQSSGDVLREFRLRLAGAILDPLADAPANVRVTDIVAEDPTVDPAFVSEILPNAFPLLIFSGWDYKTILFNVEPETTPFADIRYGQIIPDIFSAIPGVYRPFYVSNNSRAPIEATGNTVSGEVDKRLNEFKKRVFDEPEKVGVNAFAYSQGTIVARSYQAQARAQADIGGSSGPLRAAVLMGGPHHGAIQGLEFLLELTPSPVKPLSLMDLIRAWSPGTADLLDYDDATGSGNPFLFQLNRNPASLADERNVLIAGTDRRLFLPGLSGVFDAVARTAGDLVVGLGNGRHDSAIAVFSAHGKRKLGNALPSQDVPSVSLKPFGFRAAIRTEQDFNHNAAGMAFAGEDQRIGRFARSDITDQLVGWEGFRFEPQPFLCPAENAPGEINSRAIVRWNTPRHESTGAALVIYKKDGNGTWSVIAGADPETGALPPPCKEGADGCSVVTFGEIRNSEDRNEDLVVTLEGVELPELDLQDPTTRVKDITPVAVALGGSSKFSDSVPVDPNDFLFFEPPGVECPCPDAEAPACQ